MTSSKKDSEGLAVSRDEVGCNVAASDFGSVELDVGLLVGFPVVGFVVVVVVGSFVLMGCFIVGIFVFGDGLFVFRDGIFVGDGVCFEVVDPVCTFPK